MIVPASIVARLAPSISGKLTVEDQSIEVPSIAVPVVMLASPLSGFPLNSADIQRETFSTSLETTVGASTSGEATILATFGTGLWRIYFCLWTNVDVTIASQVGRNLSLNILDPTGLNVIQIARQGVALQNVQATVGSVDLFLPTDGYRIRRTSPTTGPAQSQTVIVDLICSKLL